MGRWWKLTDPRTDLRRWGVVLLPRNAYKVVKIQGVPTVALSVWVPQCQIGGTDIVTKLQEWCRLVVLHILAVDLELGRFAKTPRRLQFCEKFWRINGFRLAPRCMRCASLPCHRKNCDASPCTQLRLRFPSSLLKLSVNLRRCPLRWRVSSLFPHQGGGEAS